MLVELQNRFYFHFNCVLCKIISVVIFSKNSWFSSIFSSSSWWNFKWNSLNFSSILAGLLFLLCCFIKQMKYSDENAQHYVVLYPCCYNFKCFSKLLNVFLFFNFLSNQLNCEKKVFTQYSCWGTMTKQHGSLINPEIPFVPFFFLRKWNRL